MNAPNDQSFDLEISRIRDWFFIPYTFNETMYPGFICYTDQKKWQMYHFVEEKVIVTNLVYPRNISVAVHPNYAYIYILYGNSIDVYSMKQLIKLFTISLNYTPKQIFLERNSLILNLDSEKAYKYQVRYTSRVDIDPNYQIVKATNENSDQLEYIDNNFYKQGRYLFTMENIYKYLEYKNFLICQDTANIIHLFLIQEIGDKSSIKFGSFVIKPKPKREELPGKRFYPSEKQIRNSTTIPEYIISDPDDLEKLRTGI